MRKLMARSWDVGVVRSQASRQQRPVVMDFGGFVLLLEARVVLVADSLSPPCDGGACQEREARTRYWR